MMSARKNLLELERWIAVKCPEARRSLICLAQLEQGMKPRRYKGRNSWNFWNMKTIEGSKIWLGEMIPCKLVEYTRAGKKTKKRSMLRFYESCAQSVDDVISQFKKNWPDAWARRCEPQLFVRAMQDGSGRLGNYSTSGSYVKDFDAVVASSFKRFPPIKIKQKGREVSETMDYSKINWSLILKFISRRLAALLVVAAVVLKGAALAMVGIVAGVAAVYIVCVTFGPNKENGKK